MKRTGSARSERGFALLIVFLMAHAVPADPIAAMSRSRRSATVSC